MYGVLKHPSLHGLTDDQINSAASDSPVLERVVNQDGMDRIERHDPTGRRTGFAPLPDVASVLTKTMQDAMDYISPVRSIYVVVIVG
jgi:hypothetical protein